MKSQSTIDLVVKMKKMKKKKIKKNLDHTRRKAKNLNYWNIQSKKLKKIKLNQKN